MSKHELQKTIPQPDLDRPSILGDIRERIKGEAGGVKTSVGLGVGGVALGAALMFAAKNPFSLDLENPFAAPPAPVTDTDRIQPEETIDFTDVDQSNQEAVNVYNRWSEEQIDEIFDAAVSNVDSEAIENLDASGGETTIEFGRRDTVVKYSARYSNILQVSGSLEGQVDLGVWADYEIEAERVTEDGENYVDVTFKNVRPMMQSPALTTVLVDPLHVYDGQRWLAAFETTFGFWEKREDQLEHGHKQINVALNYLMQREAVKAMEEHHVKDQDNIDFIQRTFTSWAVKSYINHLSEIVEQVQERDGVDEDFGQVRIKDIEFEGDELDLLSRYDESQGDSVIDPIRPPVTIDEENVSESNLKLQNTIPERITK